LKNKQADEADCGPDILNPLSLPKPNILTCPPEATVKSAPFAVVSNFLLLLKNSSTELFELATILFSPATGCKTILLVPLPYSKRLPVPLELSRKLWLPL